MRKVFLLALFLLFAAYGVASATSIYHTYVTDSVGNNYVSTYGSVSVATFDSVSQGTTGSFSDGIFSFSGTGGEVVNGGPTSQYAPPYGATGPDTTNYLAVTGTETVTFTQNHNYVGLWWGSVDSYNTISFYENGTQVASYGGAAVANPANGGQTTSDTNLFVNFSGLPEFNSIVFNSSLPAFELDNLTVGPAVPEPSSLLLVLLGAVMVLGFIRRQGNDG